MIKIAVCGLGKAGMQVVRRAASDEELEIAMTFCKNGSPRAGKKLSDVLPVKMGIPIYAVAQAAEAFEREKPDVLVDFSHKSATNQLILPCAEHGVRMVVCTTGFTEPELERFRQIAGAANDFSMVYAPNITMGINVVMHLTEILSTALPNYDFVITEKHHMKKKDVSGTAKKMARRMEEILEKPVPVHSVRAGGYVGLHEILAAGENERITVIHESFSRQAFADGAILAAKYLLQHDGYCEMQDIVRSHLKQG